MLWPVRISASKLRPFNAGAVIKLTVLHGPVLKEVAVQSIDRIEFMRRKQGL